MTMYDDEPLTELANFCKNLCGRIDDLYKNLANKIADAGNWSAVAVINDARASHLESLVSLSQEDINLLDQICERTIENVRSGLDLDDRALETQLHNLMNELKAQTHENFLTLNSLLLKSMTYVPTFPEQGPYDLSKCFLRLRPIEESTYKSLGELDISISNFFCFLRSRVSYSDSLAKKVLNFFNSVNDPYKIRTSIKDDPNFGSPLTYGITLSTAKQILETRNNLPDKRLTSIRQIDEVKGVGPSTLHNILYSAQQGQLTQNQPHINLVPIDSWQIEGLRWYKRPSDGKYFDINSPTIIWIHGWPDIRIRNYSEFLYADRFLNKGYNVGIYRWDEDILDMLYVRSVNWKYGALVTANNSARKRVLTQVWKSGGSGDAFRNALQRLFGQEALKSYTHEITLVAHSTAAQVVSLGLRSFVEGSNPLEKLKFRVVFVDPFFPSLTGGVYPTVFDDPHPYNPSLAEKILSRVSDKGNPVVFIVSSLVVGVEAVVTLRNLAGKATYVRIYPEAAAMSSGYGQMREKAYSWGSNILVHPEGVRHWYSIDWYCELIDSPVPLSNTGRNVPSPNLKRTDIRNGRLYNQCAGASSYRPDDDAFVEHY